MQDPKTTISRAAVAIKRAMYRNPAWHIGKHNDGTPALDINAMQQELEDGLIVGWLGLPEVEACTLSQWSAAMELLIAQEHALQHEADRFDYTNRYDR